MASTLSHARRVSRRLDWRPGAVLTPVGLTLALTLLAACSGNPAAATGPATSNVPASAAANPGAGIDLSKVTLKVGEIASSLSPVFKFAKLDKTPYTLTFAQFAAAPPLLEALNAGALDIGQAGDTGLIAASSGGVTFKYVAAFKAPGAGMSLLVPQNSTLTSVADLKGKKVAVFHGSAGQAFLIAALKKAGLVEADINEVNLSPADAAAAFRSGQLDAWAIWEPAAAQALIGSHARLLVNGEGYYQSTGFMVTRPQTLDDVAKAAAIGDFLQRLAQANVYRSAHVSDWIGQYAQLTKVPTDVATLAAPHQLSTILPIDDSVAATYSESIATFLAAGLIKTAPDTTGIFDPRFTQQIAAGLTAPGGG